MNVSNVPGYQTFSHSNPKVPDFVPSDDISTAAWQYCIDRLPTTIYNHSLRVFLLTRCLQEASDNSTSKSPIHTQQVSERCRLQLWVAAAAVGG